MSPCAAQSTGQHVANTLNIGVLAFRPFVDERARWQPLADYLQHALDKDIRVTLEVYDFNGLRDAVKARNVDFVITNPSDYLYYTHKIGLSAPIASVIEQPPGDKNQLPLRGYGGTIVVRADETGLIRYLT